MTVGVIIEVFVTAGLPTRVSGRETHAAAAEWMSGVPVLARLIYQEGQQKAIGKQSAAAASEVLVEVEWALTMRMRSVIAVTPQRIMDALP